MGWFSKKKKEEEKEEVPSLPELPKLPELPNIEEKLDKTTEPLPRLPSFPTNSLGEKFSQNTIKDAVTGKKEGDEIHKADDFAPSYEEMQTMPESPKEFPYPKERRVPLKKKSREIPREFKEAARMVKKTEPIFIRIDKFEDSLNAFEKIKSQLSEMEKMLSDIKGIKEQEEQELDLWEKEMRTIKAQIEKIDRDIFSKID